MSIASEIGSIAGTAIGGPIGGTIGGELGNLVDGLIDGGHSNSSASAGASAGASASASSSASGANSIWGRPSQDWPGGLQKIDDKTVDTGRYQITVDEGQAKVFDKQTNTCVQVWGDPHVVTSDGDKAMFTKNNLTLDLPDGTKITFKPTDVKNNVALLDSMALQSGNVLNNADALDARYADGTVMRAGQQVDDLTFAADGSELLGTDKSNEWNLDGKGGAALNGFERGAQTGNATGTGDTTSAGGTSDTGGTSGSGSASGAGMDQDLQQLLAMIRKGGSVTSLLMLIAGKLEQTARTKMETISQKSQEYSDYQAGKTGSLGNGQQTGDATGADNGKPPVTENDLKMAMMDLQEIQNLIKQITDTASNIQKSYHDANSNIASNIK